MRQTFKIAKFWMLRIFSNSYILLEVILSHSKLFKRQRQKYQRSLMSFTLHELEHQKNVLIALSSSECSELHRLSMGVY